MYFNKIVTISFPIKKDFFIFQKNCHQIRKLHVQNRKPREHLYEIRSFLPRNSDKIGTQKLDNMTRIVAQFASLFIVDIGQPQVSL